ncbi:MAG: universal stress protein [Bacteroidetes bacterium]|nr:universal stress protein [Bacteroidota bacterium]
MKKILVYIHQINEIEHILNYSVHLAKDLEASIDLLHSVELQNFPMGVPSMARQTPNFTQEQLEKLFEDMQATFETEVKKIKSGLQNPPEINFFTRQGISTHVIEDFAKKNAYDYMVVAADEDNDFLVNDRNLDIIKHVRIPVWVIPRSKQYKKVSSIIYATDYNEEDIDTMRKIAELATIYDAHISAIHVTDNLNFSEKVKNSGFKDMITEKVGYRNLEVSTMVQKKKDTLSNTINEYAKMKNGDMIAVLKENKNFFERLFGKSDTKDLISHAKYPVLVFQQKK